MYRDIGLCNKYDARYRRRSMFKTFKSVINRFRRRDDVVSTASNCGLPNLTVYLSSQSSLHLFHCRGDVYAGYHTITSQNVYDRSWANIGKHPEITICHRRGDVYTYCRMGGVGGHLFMGGIMISYYNTLIYVCMWANETDKSCEYNCWTVRSRRYRVID